MSNSTLLIFDCDGVLVDSEPIANRALIACLQKEGFKVDEAYAWQHFHGISTRDCITHVESAFGRKVSASLEKDFSHLTNAEIRNTLQPIPFIQEVLPTLPFPKCVASGSEPDKIALSLEVTGLKKYFTHIYSSLQVERGKPFPDVFLYAANQMGFTPGQCIIIEDSSPGVQAGLQAGMQVLWYRTVKTNSSDVSNGVRVFSDMRHLPTLIQEIIVERSLQ